ncbi:Protein of unknown function [Pyronema omphalodes CBS 100304]|uniref:Uncharacterized protein n=1 Tax=Pyronema omphalodes (strain CBS 100304) TaxID=1076935 RepID=U4LPL1_PYROM|nr:Protein of unknown function [Pyronema omphalodes CBS 100304]
MQPPTSSTGGEISFPEALATLDWLHQYPSSMSICYHEHGLHTQGVRYGGGVYQGLRC